MERKPPKRRSVTKPGLKCCAPNCPASKDESVEKFFFSFPSCDLSNKRSVKSCRAWVKKTGNPNLLKCLSSKLEDNFFLCCSHFSDWTATDSSTRFIDVGAVPAYFDCPPLSNEEMEVFPVTAESLPEDNLPDNADPILSLTNDENTSSEISAQTEKQPEQPSVKTEEHENSADRDDSQLNKAEHQPGDGEPEVEKSTKRDTPSRKAKRNAVNKIISLQSAKDNDNDKPSSEKDEKETDSTSISELGKKRKGRFSVGGCEKAVNRMFNGLPLNINSDTPERLAARSTIVSCDIVSRLGTPVGSPAKVPTTSSGRSPGVTDRISKDIPESNGSAKLTSSPGLKILSSHSLQPKPKRQRKEMLVKSQELVDNYYSSASSSDSNNVMPVLISTGTQTSLTRFSQGREMLKILDDDRKLCVFSGIPSYAVLENITDATLNMVMNNRAMIHDIEPTLREWIILTCTKFNLDICTEALAVMFEVPETECKKIVEKTCLFLRKTLSLADCQKYVWVLPAKVLTGVADYSDKLIKDT